MATYYSGSTERRDVMRNLYLKEHVLNPESSVPGGMPYLNSSSSGPCSGTLPSSTQSQDNCIEIPIPTTIISQDPSVVGSTNAYNASQLGQHAYHAWMDGRSEMLLMQTIGGSINRSENLVHSSVINDPQMGLRSHLGILHGQKLSMEQSNVSPMQGQGLSLSLGTQVPVSSYQYQPGDTKISFSNRYQTSLENGESYAEDYLRTKNVNMNSTPYGLPNPISSISNSKYLKAAQQLLDEVVNVRKALKQKEDKKEGLNASSGTVGFKDNDGGSKSDGVASKPQESISNDLSPSERQDLQNKVTKLLAMLDEVDRRYKQYYHQMQIVVSSFDAIAGSGAAKPYTALALQTISRHFRCLRDAITSQIRATRKSLGEQESSSGKGIGISRLRYIDQQIRQQRAMQQFGMMQPHAWRPQRGLPESAVTILRAWLFEHFLHPYPKDAEKLMLARQTGLSRGQVSNWFINARVRLWKPMIEEMYKEEAGDVEIDSNSSSENPPNVRDEIRSSEDREDVQQSPPAEMCQTSQFSDSLKPNRTCNMDIGVTATSFQAQPNGDNAYMGLKVSEQKPTGEDCSILQEALSQQPDGGGRFFAYEMAELGRYGNSGAVSLTLGLQNCDNGSLPVSNGQQSFISMRGDIYGVVPPTSLVPEDYEYMNLGDGRHRFGSSSQLMHDFVA